MATGGNKLTETCRYFSSPSGCWYGDNCRFQHVQQQQPAAPPVCKFYGSMTGCRYGSGCRFSHVRKTDQNNNEGGMASAYTVVSPIVAVRAVKLEPVTTVPLPVAGPSSEPSGSQPDSLDQKKCKDTANIAKKEAAAKSDQKIIKCGECGMQFENDDKVYGNLQQHYANQLGKVDRGHSKFFRQHKEFVQSEAMCGVCERSFSRVPHMLNHLGSKAGQKAVNKVKRDHQTFLNEVASYFVERDLGLIEESEMLNMLTMVILAGGEDAARDGMSLYLLKRMAALGAETLDEELSERAEHGGFLEDELEELICQGIKPWDDCAWDALDVLYDF